MAMYVFPSYLISNFYARKVHSLFFRWTFIVEVPMVDYCMFNEPAEGNFGK